MLDNFILKKNYSNLAILFLVLVVGCAKISRPTGGPKDDKPPKMIESDPPMYSKLDSTFSGEIEIEFDEIIKLNSVQQALVVSPPLIERPEVKARLTTLSIDLNNELYPNETYTIDFGNSIVDNNEGNKLENFRFVFTTGSSIDSMEVAGNVYNAYSQKPAKDVTVMLYPSFEDSLPYNSKPRYIAKTDKFGRYRFTNLRNSSYKIFAITDNNKNYQYDPVQGESMAFLDSVLVTQQEQTFRIDTTVVDSLLIMFLDTVRYTHYTPDSLKLNLFTENFNKQYIKDKDRKKALIHFQFAYAPDTFSITPNNILAENWAIEENVGDSIINYWITDTTVYKNDSLSFNVGYFQKLDSNETLVWKTDTIFFRYKVRALPNDPDFVPETLFKFKSKPKSKIHYYEYPSFEISDPFVQIDESKIRLLEKQDTLVKPLDFEIKFVDNLVRKFEIQADYKNDRVYEMYLDSTAFTNVYGLVNDSLKFKFKLTKETDYGTINLEPIGFDSTTIFELMKGKKVVDRIKIGNKKSLIFKNVIPGQYKLKALEDKNNNYIWDTGIYLKHIQPERIFYFEKELKVIKNWEIEETWKQIKNQ